MPIERKDIQEFDEVLKVPKICQTCKHWDADPPGSPDAGTHCLASVDDQGACIQTWSHHTCELWEGAPDMQSRLQLKLISMEQYELLSLAARRMGMESTLCKDADEALAMAGSLGINTHWGGGELSADEIRQDCDRLRSICESPWENRSVEVFYEIGQRYGMEGWISPRELLERLEREALGIPQRLFDSAETNYGSARSDDEAWRNRK